MAAAGDTSEIAEYGRLAVDEFNSVAGYR